MLLGRLALVDPVAIARRLDALRSCCTGAGDKLFAELYAQLEAGMLATTAASEEQTQKTVQLQEVQKALHSQEQAYRHVVENAGSIILQFDPFGRLALCNRYAAATFGYSELELQSGKIISLETVFPDVRWRGRPPEDVLCELVREDKPFHHTESTFIGGDGERRWIAWVNRILLRRTGELIGVLSVGNDITSQKLNDDERRKQLHQLQEQAGLLDLAHDCIIFRERDGTIRFWNRGAEEAFGWSAADAVGQNIHDLLATQLPESEEHILAALAETGIWEGELHCRDADGAAVVMDSRWSMARAGGILEMSRNISRQKEIETALRVSEERCRMALVSSAEGVWDCDLLRGRMYVSAIGRNVLGIGDDSGYRSVRWWMKHIVKADRPAFWSAVREHLQGRSRHFSIGLRMWTANEREQPVLLTGMAFSEAGRPYRFIGTVRRTAESPMPASGADEDVAAADPAREPRSPEQELQMVGKYISRIMTDVSARENDLQEEQERLRAQERLVTVGRLAASVAHEIRNPMTAVRMRLHTLRSQVAGQAEAEEDVDVIVDELKHLEQIVSEFLDFSRPREPVLEPIGLRGILQDILLLMGRQFENHGIVVELPAASDDELVQGDRDHLKQVFVNLMKNAMDAMDGGGELRITMTAAGDHVVIRFADSGRGIPAEYQEKIFDPFFSAKEDGTGLGLSTCARLLEQQNGSLELETTGAHGTTFAVSLPAPPELN